MKIREGFVLRKVAGEILGIATGDASRDFHGMIRLNATGRDIWEAVDEGLTVEEIADRLCEKYDVSREKALADTEKTLEKLKEEGFLVP